MNRVDAMPFKDSKTLEDEKVDVANALFAKYIAEGMSDRQAYDKACLVIELSRSNRCSNVMNMEIAKKEGLL